MAGPFIRRSVNLALLGLAFGLAAPGAARPVTRTVLFDFAIAGGLHHGLRDRRESLLPGASLKLRAEPGNPHDANAVAVLAPDGTSPYLHTPNYDFNDDIIPLGVAWWVSVVDRELGSART